MDAQAATGGESVTLQQLREKLSPYGVPDNARAVWQVINTCVPYVALWALLVCLIQHGYPFWTLPVPLVLAAAFYVRIFILFGIAPLILFLVAMRFPSQADRKAERFSVRVTNLALVALLLAAIWAIGLRTFLLIQLPILALAASAGVWLFYVQHQFEGVYWERSEEWDYCLAALQGSSFYKLPKVLQWFSGNIGFHHIHHLSPRIPNYHLEKCHQAEPLFQTVKAVTLVSSLKSFTFRLWDEQRRKLVGYRALRAIRKQQGQAGA
jgi:omega-6 fatty acid desaturase (delta-12 desaturase)